MSNMAAPTTADYVMKNLSRKKHTERTDQESPEELGTQGYQRRFFNSSPLVFELAAALDQAFAEIEPTLTDDDDLDQNGDSDLVSPFVADPINETGTGIQ